MASYLLLTVATLQGVRAWGTLGHATIAYIAQNYVTDEVASWAQGILDDDSDSYLANIASWADTYRATTAGAWSAPFHFIDAEDDPPSDCNVDYERDCTTAGCSISAISNYTSRVTESSIGTEQIAEALKFIVHFVGDITQPLHDEAYEVGGNDIAVTYQGYSDNLHSDWDTYMPETLVGGYALTDAKSWATDLIKEIDSGDYKALAADWISGDDTSEVIDTATTWASDANAYVCTVVMPNGAAALEDASDLYPTYYDSVIPTIELQIAKGGYRLGNWLNLIYTNDLKKRENGDVSITKREASTPFALPANKPMSRAQMARAESGYKCNHSKRDGHHHH
ncbi:putative nuclease S1 precursor [Cryphonectria parasitica EP155]|uniref:Nuclease S1 n=1 Tax=Cryphonectria parasitica (strain ATCC 38755 / EP155) TaxID=660469 RepID=A0A9P4YEG4_CRYP1|nr:putative nuclease S1 precursor [Cryphonectria parasitica EP155]KAF3771398.1 putative nuclease S1 precursor [Cryphonectria parasitica EP155]